MVLHQSNNMKNKKYKPTIRDLVLGQQVSDSVVKRGKVLDDYTRQILEERKKRKYKGKLFRTKKEKQLIKDAKRIGNSPSASGVKFPRIYGFGSGSK